MSENVPSGKQPDGLEMVAQGIFDPAEIFYGGSFVDAAYVFFRATEQREEAVADCLRDLPKCQDPSQAQIEREKVRMLESIIKDKNRVIKMLFELLAQAKAPKAE